MKNLNQKIQELINLFKSENFINAEIQVRDTIKKYPNNAFLYNFLGLVLSKLNRDDEAIKVYKKGIKIEKNFSMFYNNLGTIYQSRKEYKKAENFYKRAVSIDKKQPEAQNNLGNLYRALNQNTKAISFYKQAIKIKKNFFPSHFNLGILYKNMGEFEKAKAYLNETTRINPLLYTAHRNISEIIKYSNGNDHLNFLIKIYNNDKNNSLNKKEICFALGKAYEDMKIYDKAFKYYYEGNNLQRETIKFSLNDEMEEFSTIKKKFNKQLYENNRIIGNQKDTMIFILGMPRSGTTLVEQIISSHPNVHGGDELDIIPDLIKKYFRDSDNKLVFNQIDKKNNMFIKKIAKQYLNEVKIISKKKKVTDKLPVNFKWIGLIKLLLPNSKIIHCKRNSKDLCFSIFKNYFVSKDLKYAYNLKEISSYYYLYNDLMNHWQETLPGYIYEIKYEEIIHNTKFEIKKLLNSLNLGWNSKCLDFYKSKRAVKTASDTQIRRKIYKSSIDSWKNFETYMGDFFKSLPD